jgi:hypothetical protein
MHFSLLRTPYDQCDREHMGAHGSTFLYCFFVRSFPAKSASFWKFCPFPKFRSWDQNPPDWGDCLGLLIVPQATQSILVFHWPTIVCVLSRLVLCLFSCSAWYYRRHELCFRVNRFCVDHGQTLRRPHPSGASGGQEMRTRMSCAYVYNIYIVYYIYILIYIRITNTSTVYKMSNSQYYRSWTKISSGLQEVLWLNPAF